MTTLAGLALASGSTDGAGAAARFNNPSGTAVDSSGNVYVTDTNNHTIRKITPAGMVSTLAGLALASGSADGTGSAARFKSPVGVAVDSAGVVYVADTGNFTIRKITPAGVVTTLAGLAGSFGTADGIGSAARFRATQGVTVDASFNLFVADINNHTIRKITPAGAVTTYAGSAGTPGSTDGTAAAARFRNPYGVAVDSAGNVYVSDSMNYTIRMITPARVVTTLAGSAGSQGSADGTGVAARFSILGGIAADGAGVMFVADPYNHTLRRVTPTGVVTTLAGLGKTTGGADGTGSDARFYSPWGVAVNGAGTVYVGDSYNHTIRKITPEGIVTTLAGLAGTSGSTDDTGAAARFFYPRGVAADSAGIVYVADNTNHTIRKITPAGAVTTLAGLAGSIGSANGTGNFARFNFPRSVAVDPAFNVYVSDSSNHTIRKITPAGVVTTLAGLAGSLGSADGSGGTARFNRPSGIAVDATGTVYVCDSWNHTLRMITPAGAVTTLAGLAGFIGSADGTGSAARFNNPVGIAVDGAGIVYVSDSGNFTIRKITPAGVVTTAAGLATWPGSADGTGGAARFNYPYDISVNSAGNLLYVADESNDAIRSGVPAISDTAMIDAAAGCTGAARQLDTAPQTATRWQWRMIRQPAGSAAAISQAAIRNPTFTPDVADRYEFLLTATGAAGSSVTTIAFTGAAAPAIGGQPVSQSVCAGGSATFTFSAGGASGYQWYISGNPISGATAGNYTLNPVATGDAGTYYASATVACGTIFSNNAALSVQSAPSSPGDSLRGGKDIGQVIFNWAAADGASVYDVKRCTGACVPTLTAASPSGTSYIEPDDPDSYFYSVEARNACGSTP